MKNPEVITTLLLESGADKSAVDERRETPYDRAIYNEALVGHRILIGNSVTQGSSKLFLRT